MSSSMNFFKPESSNQINWIIFTQSTKILMHFQDKSGKVCFLVHPLIPLIIITLQNYFDQNFYLEKMFPGICNKIHSHLKFLSCPPSISLGGSRMSSIFVSTDSFFKNFKYIYIFFSIQDVFLKIFGQFNLAFLR